MLTKDDRINFVSRMKGELSINNYGFVISNPLSRDRAEAIPAIKELLIRLFVFQEKGEYSSGKINHPDAHRKIIYQFHPDTLDKCIIRFTRVYK